MAKIISIDTFDLVNSKTSGKRHINADHIIELEDLISYDSKPLTRIKLANGDFLDTQISVDELTKQLNG
jgi:hypothetical protein